MVFSNRFALQPVRNKLIYLPPRLEGLKKFVLKIFILESLRLSGKSNVNGQSVFPGASGSNCFKKLNPILNIFLLNYSISFQTKLIPAVAGVPKKFAV
jgi:hypothetical protein